MNMSMMTVNCYQICLIVYKIRYYEIAATGKLFADGAIMMIMLFLKFLQILESCPVSK
jgi:hypothetical protein